MFTNEDYERLLVKYTTQGIPAGESIQHFCDRMNVPYNLFNKWYRDTRHKIVKVKVDGMPSTAREDRDDCLMDSLVSEGLESRQVPVADIPAAEKRRVPVTAQTQDKPTRDNGRSVENEGGKTVRIMIDLRTTSGLRVSRKGMTYPQFLDLATKLSQLC